MIAALDVGTSKVTCFIAERDGQGELAIVGIGQDTAEGLKAGTVTDMAAAVKSLGTAVHRAEVMADTRVRELFVSVSGGALHILKIFCKCSRLCRSPESCHLKNLCGLLNVTIASTQRGPVMACSLRCRASCTFLNRYLPFNA